MESVRSEDWPGPMLGRYVQSYSESQPKKEAPDGSGGRL